MINWSVFLIAEADKNLAHFTYID